MLIRDAEIAGATACDVRIEGNRIREIGAQLARATREAVLEANGAALLPGLHDHHIHLFALAAARSSLACGPPAVVNGEQLASALADAARTSASDAWLRGVGYHESVAGDLDRDRLDAWVADRPLRIQHRSGALWIVNSAAALALGLDSGADPRGAERDAHGRATGRLFRLDDWLRERWGGSTPPDLADVSSSLARYGVTGVTDATATNDAAAVQAFVDAIESGSLLQSLTVMGRTDLPVGVHPLVARGPVKLLLDERDLPEFDALTSAIAAAHAEGRNAAIHCVTRAELVLATAAFEAAGGVSGDRIEHAGIAPPAALPALQRSGLAVVTQPHFIFERGDAYLEEVEARDQPWLYRARGLLEAGIPLGGGSDAPYGDCNPWAAMQAAVLRRTRNGAEIAPEEALSPEQALALFTSAADSVGGPPRRVEIGARADLCLLDRPWAEARRSLEAVEVRSTLQGGRLISGD